jgi:hypothetical protein
MTGGSQGSRGGGRDRAFGPGRPGTAPDSPECSTDSARLTEPDPQRSADGSGQTPSSRVRAGSGRPIAASTAVTCIRRRPEDLAASTLRSMLRRDELAGAACLLGYRARPNARRAGLDVLPELVPELREAARGRGLPSGHAAARSASSPRAPVGSACVRTGGADQPESRPAPSGADGAGARSVKRARPPRGGIVLGGSAEPHVEPTPGAFAGDSTATKAAHADGTGSVVAATTTSSPAWLIARTIGPAAIRPAIAVGSSG